MVNMSDIRMGTLVRVRFDLRTFRYGVVYELRADKIYAQFINDNGDSENYSFQPSLITNLINLPQKVS